MKRATYKVTPLQFAFRLCLWGRIGLMPFGNPHCLIDNQDHDHGR